ncbi:hypothetical protein PLICRDRAFT_179337 [Plicaturopsis crispa FD-325 SS-3]|uniref:Secreted protein n=1 Tax=Plicaturopsis crispa FD-325 SS-3 TaxID=944288 RepID=A0A0C9T8G9_PLICR|nr:hypothetical protein PLICRDRAFT_179337 [Plicaturopsis crispa FD-325 SS-3]
MFVFSLVVVYLPHTAAQCTPTTRPHPSRFREGWLSFFLFVFPLLDDDDNHAHSRAAPSARTETTPTALPSPHHRHVTAPRDDTHLRAHPLRTPHRPHHPRFPLPPTSRRPTPRTTR